MATSTEIFCCPICKGPLDVNGQSLRCAPCQHVFPVVRGIPDLFVAASDNDYIDEPNKTWLVPEIVEARDTYYRLCTRELRGMRYCMAEIGARTFPGCRVLEVGMGTGHFTRWLAEVSQPATEIFAFDFSWPIIEKAIANTVGLSGVDIFRANARGRLPLRDGAFDIVFLRLAPLGAHGVPNVVAALELLKPGGWFFEAGWKRDLFEIGPTEWAIMHGFASAEHHMWQYERVLSDEEYTAKSLEQDYLEQQYKPDNRPPKKATYQARPGGIVEMVVENLTIAQKPEEEAAGVQ
jgi:SAM-dependent methyltransferase